VSSKLGRLSDNLRWLINTGNITGEKANEIFDKYIKENMEE